MKAEKFIDRLCARNPRLRNLHRDARHVSAIDRLVLAAIADLTLNGDIAGEYAPGPTCTLEHLVITVERDLNMFECRDEIKASLRSLADHGFFELTSESAVRFPQTRSAIRRADGRVDGRSLSSQANGAKNVTRRNDESDEQYLARREQAREIQRIPFATCDLQHKPPTLDARDSPSTSCGSAPPVDVGDKVGPEIGLEVGQSRSEIGPELGPELGPEVGQSRSEIGLAVSAPRAAAAAFEPEQDIESQKEKKEAAAARARANAPELGRKPSLPPIPEANSPCRPTPEFSEAERLLELALKKWPQWERRKNLIIIQELLHRGVPYQMFADAISKRKDHTGGAGWFRKHFADRLSIILEPAEQPSAASTTSIPDLEPVSMDGPHGDVWQRVREALSRQLNAVEYRTWISPLALVAVESDGTVVLHAPKASVRNEVMRNYASRLEQLWEGEEKRRRIDIRVGPDFARSLPSELAQSFKPENLQTELRPMPMRSASQVDSCVASIEKAVQIPAAAYPAAPPAAERS